MAESSISRILIKNLGLFLQSLELVQEHLKLKVIWLES